MLVSWGQDPRADTTGGFVYYVSVFYVSGRYGESIPRYMMHVARRGVKVGRMLELACLGGKAPVAYLAAWVSKAVLVNTA